jgi:hypothetical protein
MRTDDRGAAVIVALLASGLLAALGLSLVLLGDMERRVAANYASSLEGFYGVDAAVDRAMQDLGLLPQWDAVLSGIVQSSFTDASRRPALAPNEVIDLDALTIDVQSASRAAGSLGANTPVWRLFAWGPISRMGPVGWVDSAPYIAVWIADDPSETDGNPAADANGIISVHAESFGLGGARRMVEATVARVSSGALRLMSWREIR